MSASAHLPIAVLDGDRRAETGIPESASLQQRLTYDRYYSVQRLRNLAEKRFLADRRKSDLWLSLLSTFRLFEAHSPGIKMGIYPLDVTCSTHQQLAL